MHELSIAMSIIDVVEEQADKLGAKVIAIRLRLGPLSGVVKEALISAYKLACEGSSLVGTRLVIEDVPLIAWCPACNCERAIASVQYICCPNCDTPTPDIRSGREMEVSGLEIVDDAQDTNGRSSPAGAQAE